MTDTKRKFTWQFVKVDSSSGMIHSGIAHHLKAGQVNDVLSNVERIPTSTAATPNVALTPAPEPAAGPEPAE